MNRHERQDIHNSKAEKERLATDLFLTQGKESFAYLPLVAMHWSPRGARGVDENGREETKHVDVKGDSSGRKGSRVFRE